MAYDPRRVADTGLPDDSMTDWSAIFVRLVKVEQLLGGDGAEAEAILDETDDKVGKAIVDFCKRNEVSMAWLVFGIGPVMTEDGRPNIAREC